MLYTSKETKKTFTERELDPLVISQTDIPGNLEIRTAQDKKTHLSFEKVENHAYSSMCSMLLGQPFLLHSGLPYFSPLEMLTILLCFST